MAQGEWDFFDFIISIIILLISVKFLKKSSFKSNIIVSLFFGLILTTLSLSLISTTANVLSNCFLSTVSMETYKDACFSKKDKYTLYSISDYTIRNFKEEHDEIKEATIKNWKSLKI